MFFAQIVLNSLISGTHVLFLATALYLVHTVTRTLHPAIGAISVASGYAYYFSVREGAPFVLGVALGVLAGVALQYASFLALGRFFQESKRFIALLGSLALGTAIESLLAIFFGSSGRFLSDRVLPTFEFLGLRMTFVGILTLGIGLAVSVLALVGMRMLPYGRVLRAIAGHPETAESMGIRKRRVQLIAFGIVGGICAIVGMLKGFQETVTPMAGLLPTITAFFALIVGGMNDFRGIAIASYFLVLVPNVLVSLEYAGRNVSSSWSIVIVFAVSLVLLAFRPKGLFAPSLRNS